MILVSDKELSYFYKNKVLENLTIYKASAGSGKTYRLVREYILLLFQNRYNFRHILAVTFTNKATAEMKSKVVNELFLLSKPDTENRKSEHRQALKEAFPFMSEAEIMKIAVNILSLILNNYSHFFISTIDKFFQYIIKSFSKELGIFNNYNLQLDNRTILTEAVEQLFMNLEETEQSELLNWLTVYAESRVEEGEKYDITGDIIRLGNELFKEGFKTEKQNLFDALKDKQTMLSISKDLKKRIRLLENEFVIFGEKGLEMIENFGLEITDFKYGKGTGLNVFAKLANRNIDKELLKKRTLDMAEDDNAWVTKSSTLINEVATARDNGLKALLLEYLAFHDDNFELLQSLSAISRNFFTLGIFIDLHQSVKAYTEEHNLLLLSDSNEMIDAIIGDNDTPFIYEKAGNTFGYFMIDEFQDTSNMQWKNFKPLISNSLAFGHPNLLVGDVKQSIYRWRNSDWQLLANTVYSEFSAEQINDEYLDKNWRSSENIVRFNNFIFDHAPEILQNNFNNSYPSENRIWEQMITRAYENQRQDITHQDGYGYVYFKNFGKKEEFETEDILEQTVSFIENAQERGYQPGDIAVLVRKNSEGAELIKYLLHYKHSDKARSDISYDVISSDSLILGASEVLRFIVNVLNLETEPDNLLLISEINYFISASEPITTTRFNPEKDRQVVLHDAIAEKLHGLEKLSLKEKTDAIIQRFNLEDDPEQIIFIEAFRDVLNEYVKRYASDVYGFLNHWDEIRLKSSVQPPKTENAIQVLTIHKAKGLEFPIVIIPFASWKLDIDKNTNVAWCKVPESLNLPLPIVPVQLTNALKDTVFKDTLMEEQLLTNVDNLNLLYVALTRAKTELYILGSLVNSNSVTTLLDTCLKSVSDTMNITEHEEGFTTFGECKVRQNRQEQTDQASLMHLDGLTEASKTSPVIRQNAPKVFSLSETDLMAKAHIGTFLHEAFRQGKNAANICRNIERQSREGKISSDESQRLIEIVTGKFNHPLINRWFSSQNTVLNEISIRQKDREWRPDKVILNAGLVEVIDYKFGEIDDPKYHRQVATYKNLLNRMGFSEVKGYLWYVAMDKIVEV
ncbi:UvrD-helicase domain-containing protein [Saccharicrinis sp. FJH54]|uniref:UvrD-helicase domain-containing protein n=1 Tax=Saccharicrinis sp. FJH54 TaxID=3344665 RepID=UPI0035D50CF1